MTSARARCSRARCSARRADGWLAPTSADASTPAGRLRLARAHREVGARSTSRTAITRSRSGSTAARSCSRPRTRWSTGSASACSAPACSNLEQLREAERCFAPPARFGKVLVERGFLTPRELWNGVKYQVEEIVRSLLLYRAGRVVLLRGRDAARQRRAPRAPDAPARRRGRAARRRAAQVPARARERARRARRGGRAPRRASRGASARSSTALRAESRFGPLCERLGVEPEAAARSVQLLRLMGAVKLVRARDEPGVRGRERPRRRGGRAAARARVERLAKLLGELAAPIVAVEGAAPPPRAPRPRARGGRRALSRRSSPASRSARAATLDPEPLIERALRLPGDREEQVAAALGELVAYLEFELKNHPQVPDPDGLLEGLAILRAEALPS